MLGLFPLNLVVFPGVRLALHIFEPRYRTLIGQCVESGMEFGINLVEQGHLHPVGCTARVVEVTQTYADGRMDIIIEGTRRYRLLAIRDDERPYAVGDVEAYDDYEGPVDTMLAGRCGELYNQIVDLVYGEGGPRMTPTMLATDTPSWLMAPKSGLSLDQKQKFLEILSENGRLEFLFEHLSEIVPTVRQAEAVQRIVQGDGYLPPNDV